MTTGQIPAVNSHKTNYLSMQIANYIVYTVSKLYVCY